MFAVSVIRVHTESCILEKSRNYFPPTIFQTWRKSGGSLEKMVKSLEFFESYNKCFTSETFFGAG